MLFVLVVVSRADKYDKYMAKERYKKAVEYIEKKNNKPEDRTPETWYKIGYASEKLEMSEKALSCYLSANRMSEMYYEPIIGAVRMYNKIGHYTSSYIMSKKAIERKQTEEAYFELGYACYKLGKNKEAKEALRQVSSKVEAVRMLGFVNYREGEVEAAVDLFTSVFNSNPDIEICKIIVDYNLKQKKYDIAIKYLEYLYKNDKNNDTVKFELARSYFMVQRYLNGSRIYESLSEGKFEVVDFYNMGLANETMDQLNAAEKYFLAVVDKTNDNDSLAISSRLKLAMITIERKDFNAAKVQLEKLIRVSKTDQVLYLSAQCYDGLEDFKQSVYYASEYLKFDSVNISMLMILANAYEKLNYKTKAETIRKSIIESDLNNAKTQLEMGKYYFEHGRYTQAIKFFDKSYLLEQDQKAAEILAVCSYRVEQFSKAKDAAESAIMRNERSVPAREILYKILMDEKKYDVAAYHLEYLVNKIGQRMEYLEALVICYQTLDLKDKLLKIDERIVEIDATNETSIRRLAENRFEIKKYEDALNLYSQLVAINKVKEEDYPNMINCALKLDLKDKAIDILKKYSSIRSKDASVCKWLADICYDVKRYDEALSNYRFALQYDSQIKGLHKNFTMILIIKKFSPTIIIDAAEKAISFNEVSDELYSGLGDAYVEVKNFKKALESYQLAQKDKPKDMSLLRKVAECQIAIGSTNEAIVSYEQIVMIDTSDKQSYKILGELYDKKSDIKQSINNYKKYSDFKIEDDIVTKIAMYEYEKSNFKEADKYFKKMTSYSNQTMFAHGESSLKIKDYTATINILKEFVKKYPEHNRMDDVNKCLAIAYDSLKNVSEAIVYYVKYVMNVSDMDMSYRLGELQEKVNVKDAELTYKKNTSLFAKDYRNYYRLGVMYNDDLKKSSDMLEMTVALNDTLFDAWLKLGQIYHKLNDDDNKIRAYKKVIEMNPQNFEANKYLGMALYKKGKLKESILYLELARNQNYNDADILFTLALCYIPENKTNEVIMLLQTAKNIKRNDTFIRYVLASQLAKADRLSEAIREMEDILRLDDNDKYFKTYISLLFTAKKYDDIETIIKFKRRSNPENIYLLINLARAQAKNNKILDAIESYKMALIINSEQVEALYERAVLHLNRYEFDNARTYFEKVLVINKKHVQSELGLVKVYEALGDKKQCLEHLRKAQDIDPNNSEVLTEVSKLSESN